MKSNSRFPTRVPDFSISNDASSNPRSVNADQGRQDEAWRFRTPTYANRLRALAALVEMRPRITIPFDVDAFSEQEFANLEMRARRIYGDDAHKRALTATASASSTWPSSAQLATYNEVSSSLPTRNGLIVQDFVSQTSATAGQNETPTRSQGTTQVYQSPFGLISLGEPMPEDMIGQKPGSIPISRSYWPPRDDPPIAQASNSSTQENIHSGFTFRLIDPYPRMTDAEIKCLRTMKNVIEFPCDLSDPRIEQAVIKFRMKHAGKSPEAILASAKSNIKACQTSLTLTGEIGMDPTGLDFFSDDEDGNYWTDGHVFFAVADYHFIPVLLTKNLKEIITSINTAALSSRAVETSPTHDATIRTSRLPTPGASGFQGLFKQNPATSSTEVEETEPVNDGHGEDVISVLEDIKLGDEAIGAAAGREDLDTDSSDDDEDGGVRL